MLSHLAVSAAGEAGTTATLHFTEKTAETLTEGVWNPQHLHLPPPLHK